MHHDETTIEYFVTGRETVLTPYTVCQTAVPPTDQTDKRLEHCESLISDEERNRASRFHFFEDYSAYVTAHALLRASLTKCNGSVAPRDWIFDKEPAGKPILMNGHAAGRLYFSLSHARRFVACLISREGECGIDVEEIGRIKDPLALAQSCFSQVEIEDLRRLSGRHCDEYFTALWCLKEAYLKARGVGLTVPLNNFSFRTALHHQADVAFLPPIGNSPEGWSFSLLRLCETHMTAVAIHLPNPL